MRNLLGMNGAEIRISFKRNTEAEVVAYRPGETVAAMIEIRPEKDINCRDVRVSIGWYTEGKGDRDSQDVYTEPTGVTTLMQGQPEQFNVACPLPRTPHSYRGQLISVVWQMQVTIDIALMPDIQESRVFVLRP